MMYISNNRAVLTILQVDGLARKFSKNLLVNRTLELQGFAKGHLDSPPRNTLIVIRESRGSAGQVARTGGENAAPSLG